jgi:hypothetical protein
MRILVGGEARLGSTLDRPVAAPLEMAHRTRHFPPRGAESPPIPENRPVLGPNGSLYPWIAPFVFALLGAALLATERYLAGAIFVLAAIIVRWLHQIAIDRGEDP